MGDTFIPQIVELAIREDLPHGDLTTDSLPLAHVAGRARLMAKEDLILSGVEVFNQVFKSMDQLIECQWFFKNGDLVLKGQTLCQLNGNLAGLLKGERVALNFLGRLSGVATLTRCFVDKIKHTKTKLLDTRKTTPGLRYLEKAAVIHGGGVNHRMSLSDAVLIKENHIAAIGSLEKTISHLHAKYIRSFEVEVRNIDEVREALRLNVTHLLFDNMSNEQIAEALKIIPGTVRTEASGNMTIERVASVAELGVDFISVGIITHSAPCADLSLLFEESLK